nr:hypothetical protein [Tanacetum cinerariifolium]
MSSVLGSSVSVVSSVGSCSSIPDGGIGGSLAGACSVSVVSSVGSCSSTPDGGIGGSLELKPDELVLGNLELVVDGFDRWLPGCFDGFGFD